MPPYAMNGEIAPYGSPVSLPGGFGKWARWEADVFKGVELVSPDFLNGVSVFSD